MNKIVELIHKTPLVSTFNLYKKLGYKEHRMLKKVIIDNKGHFDNIGFLQLQLTKPKLKSKGGRPEESFFLTEDHFILLVVLCKNTKDSVALKVRVCNEFTRMKNELQRIATQQTNEQWVDARKTGKSDRRIETDIIKTFIEYAKQQGGSVKGCDLYYSNISKMENKALFIIEQKYNNLRDVLGIVDLLTIQQADRIVAKALCDGMDNELNYKDIYILCKNRINMFAEIRGQSMIGAIGHDK